MCQVVVCVHFNFLETKIWLKSWAVPLVPLLNYYFSFYGLFEWPDSSFVGVHHYKTNTNTLQNKHSEMRCMYCCEQSHRARLFIKFECTEKLAQERSAGCFAATVRSTRRITQETPFLIRSNVAYGDVKNCETLRKTLSR